jgi:hypothetical protein
MNGEIVIVGVVVLAGVVFLARHPVKLFGPGVPACCSGGKKACPRCGGSRRGSLSRFNTPSYKNPQVRQAASAHDVDTEAPAQGGRE